jgi:hypothetical protein
MRPSDTGGATVRRPTRPGTSLSTASARESLLELVLVVFAAAAATEESDCDECDDSDNGDELGTVHNVRTDARRVFNDTGSNRNSRIVDPDRPTTGDVGRSDRVVEFVQRWGRSHGYTGGQTRCYILSVASKGTEGRGACDTVVSSGPPGY